LKDHGDFVSADRPHHRPFGIKLRKVSDGSVTGVQDLTGFDPARFLDQPHDGQGGHRFPTTTFSHEPQGLFRFNREVNPIYGFDESRMSLEDGDEPPDLNQ